MQQTLRSTSVVVIYNGLERELPYEPHAAVQALLQRARNEFGINQNPHLLGLFTEQGQELNDQQSAEAAGIHPGTRLLLRPSAVRGGTDQ